jgi:hypothetical protein
LTRNAHLPTTSADEAEFWERVDASAGPATRDVVAYFLCSAGGRVVPVKNKNLARALAEWDRLPPSARASAGSGSARGAGQAAVAPELLEPPPDALILRVWVRALGSDSQGRVCPPERSMLSTRGVPIAAAPNSDCAWLTAGEWRSLLPATPSPGLELEFPAPIRDRLLRFHAGDGSRNLGGTWKPSEIRAASLRLTVVDVGPDRVRARLSGSAQLRNDPDRAHAQWGYEPRFEGCIEYDPRRMRIGRFDLVAVGECWGELNDAAPKLRGPYRYPLGIAFEKVDGAIAANRLPPHMLWRDLDVRRNRNEYLTGSRDEPAQPTPSVGRQAESR